MAHRPQVDLHVLQDLPTAAVPCTVLALEGT
jgi:hypothetical protein